MLVDMAGPKEGVFTDCEVFIEGPVPEALTALFSRLDNDAESAERPVKRRKTSTQRFFEEAEHAESVLSNYFTLAIVNLCIRFNSGRLHTSQTQSPKVPVIIRHMNSSYKLRVSLDTTICIIEAETLWRGRWKGLSLAASLVSLYQHHASLPTSCCISTLREAGGDETHMSFILETKILYRDSILIPDRVNEAALCALSQYPGGKPPQLQPKNRRWPNGPSWTPSDFYDSVHVPADKSNLSSIIQSDLLEATLFPFQTRAVRWLLEKEGMEASPGGHVRPLDVEPDKGLPDSFIETRDAEGRQCFMSHLFRVVTSDISAVTAANRTLNGGILAEEMGLGKTVEMIALICLNRRRNVPNFRQWPELTDSGATLIITPSAILEQWKQEIETHAPRLHCVYYKGINRSVGTGEDVKRELASSDVVLTTYDVLRTEIHYAADPPARSMRHEKKFVPRKSPLVQISWWRVCIDEAQMIESGVSNAAKVALAIPRHNAWAVSGTPLRKDMKDLYGLITFLCYEPFCDAPAAWTRLYEEFKPEFKRLIGKLVLRHNKDVTRDEVQLPRQKRIVITVPFTPVEEQHYSQLFEEMCEDCGLDTSGAPCVDDWNPQSKKVLESMRHWLTRLRQTCLHPEVGGGGRRVFGASSGPLRQVSEVLEVMIDQNEVQIRAEERSLLLSQARRGQLLENAGRQQEALKVWQDALVRAQSIVSDCRSQLDTARQIFHVARVAGDDDSSDDEEDDSNEDTKREKKRIGTYRQRLRAALEVEHICKFFIANAYYQIKTNTELTEPESENYRALEKLEEDAYEEAKVIRKEMLADTNRKVSRYINSVKVKVDKEGFVEIPPMLPQLDMIGIESRRILDRLEEFCEAMNEHAEQYKKWRSHMVKLLVESLIDEEDGAELEGNEYESSTKHQDEMYVYMEALRVMFADRHDAITGQTNILIAHELKQGLDMAKAGEGPSPELFISLMNKSKELKVSAESGSLRGILGELRSLATSLEWQEARGSSRARAESAIVNHILRDVAKISTVQSRTISKLEKEVELFRDVMNHRLEYYRQLQQISDTVAPYDEESKGKSLDVEQFDSKLQLERSIDAKIASLRSKHRYLLHLRDESGAEEETRTCVICQSTFEIGVLTVCGHKYCKDCLGFWWRQHRTCPTCKTRLRANDFHQITYKPKELVAHEEKTASHLSHLEHHQPAKNSIYSDISSGVLKEIRDVELDGSFGTKIDTLARHLIWLRQHDPGAKSIVFSQYKPFLGILSSAFSRFKIGYTSVDNRNGIERFKADPSIECFLLHAKAHSSGLNLVNATHVFLCEPLIHTAIELQAIARVHRIGQHRETTVWMYLVSGSVEESIYEISVSRRLAHIARKQKEEKNAHHQSRITEFGTNGLTEDVIDSANSFELQDSSLANLMAGPASEGERVDESDLWQCLFGKVGKNGRGESEAARNEVDRFLRAEAAENRRHEQTNGHVPNGINDA